VWIVFGFIFLLSKSAPRLPEFKNLSRAFFFFFAFDGVSVFQYSEVGKS